MADETNRPNANTTPPGAAEPEAKPAEAGAGEAPAVDAAKLAAEVETLHGQIADPHGPLAACTRRYRQSGRKRLDREKGGSGEICHHALRPRRRHGCR